MILSPILAGIEQPVLKIAGSSEPLGPPDFEAGAAPPVVDYGGVRTHTRPQHAQRPGTATPRTAGTRDADRARILLSFGEHPRELFPLEW